MKYLISCSERNKKIGSFSFPLVAFPLHMFCLSGSWSRKQEFIYQSGRTSVFCWCGLLSEWFASPPHFTLAVVPLCWRSRGHGMSVVSDITIAEKRKCSHLSVAATLQRKSFGNQVQPTPGCVPSTLLN